MKATGFLIFAALLVVRALAPAPAHAATAIYYSEPENAYGWCAGYGHSKANSCAKKECQSQDGSDCQLALECNGGWGAVALAEDPATGIGMSCGMSNSYVARAAALAACVNFANALCTTDYAFDANANSLAESDNTAFDSIWYGQTLLQIRKFDLDASNGRMDDATRSAIKAFQKQIAFKQTGKLDDDTFARLIDAVGGRQHLIDVIKRDLYGDMPKDFADIVHGEASTVAPDVSIGKMLTGLDDDHRLLALATMLSASGSPCTLPAKAAEEIETEKDGLSWQVTCKEDTYKLYLSEDGSRTIMTEGK